MKKILIVDNEKFFAENLCMYLTKFALCVVDICNEFNNAIDKVKFTKYDTTIIDINLNNGSGLTLAEIIKQNSPETKVILTSTNLDKFNIKSCFNYYILEKPFDINDLIELINSKPIK